ncbi:MAG: peptidase, partial [Candidatus Diapherotrites archaeon]|nr:peptidase [Candidatus Diapherotrites archaeon]
VILMGVIMIIGFLGEVIFKRTGVPNVIWLLLLGLAMGPIFHLVDPTLFLQLSELFAAIAIIIILYDGGLNLDVYKVLRGAPRGLFLALLSFTVSVLVVAGIAMFLGFDPIIGVLLGAIVGGSSSPIVIPLVAGIKGISEDTKTVLSIESAATDALCVVVVIALIQGIVLGIGLLEAIQNIASAFSIGAVLGVIVGVGWVHVLKYLKKMDYSYIVTIALLFLLYASTEALGGSGAIAMLLFGITVGNGKAIYSMLRYKHPFELDDRTKDFNSLIAFFVRTFFFVYMGLLVTLTDVHAILIGVVAVIAIALIRPGAVQIAIYGEEKRFHIKPMAVMIPRGLAAAVLAFLPLSSGVPNTHWFPDAVFTIILGTTLITTIGAYKIRQEAEVLEDKKEKEDAKALRAKNKKTKKK